MNGIGTGGGKAFAEIYIVRNSSIEIKKAIIDNIEYECERIDIASEIAKKQIKALMKRMSERQKEDNVGILDYQLLLLEDQSLIHEIKKCIKEESVNAEYALDKCIQSFVTDFSKMENSYLQERISDVYDMEKRVQMALAGKAMFDISCIEKECIIAADEMLPSQVMGMDRKNIKGIIMEFGGKTSHSVIIAHSLGIPCIVGLQRLMDTVRQGQVVIMDGDSGEVNLNPSQGDIASFKEYQEKNNLKNMELRKFADKDTVTLDGIPVRIFANISSENDIDALLESGGQGVGLFRTEFIYLNSKALPSEEHQYKVYLNIAKKLEDRPFIVRTLDVGGDKGIDYLNIKKEENPFLGFRAIRYCLKNPSVFKTQIAAILRASTSGNIRFMIPMIATLFELRQAKKLIEEVKQELESKDITFCKNTQIGMMVETPSAALMADRFAKEVDFFSIGTNDLTQYLFAADRLNEEVAYLNNNFHPQFLRLVKNITQSGKKYGIEVDICGQAGENPYLIPLWIAMGVDNLSVTIPSILKVKQEICNINKMELIPLMEKVLQFDDAYEVEEFLKIHFKNLVW
jgi:phosphotransferase system enzyme I (PtsI)